MCGQGQKHVNGTTMSTTANQNLPRKTVMHWYRWHVQLLSRHHLIAHHQENDVSILLVGLAKIWLTIETKTNILAIITRRWKPTGAHRMTWQTFFVPKWWWQPATSIGAILDINTRMRHAMPPLVSCTKWIVTWPCDGRQTHQQSGIFWWLQSFR